MAGEPGRQYPARRRTGRMSQLQPQPTDDDTFYIMLPDNIPSAADVGARLAKEAAERAEQLQLETRLKSIANISWEQCPWPAVRNELMGRILSGAPITAYS